MAPARSRALAATAVCLLACAGGSAAAKPGGSSVLHPSRAAVRSENAELASLQHEDAATKRQLAASQQRTLAYGTQLDQISGDQSSLQSQLQTMAVSVYESEGASGGSAGQLLSAGNLREVADTAALLSTEQSALVALQHQIDADDAQSDQVFADRDAQESQSAALTVQDNAYQARISSIEAAQEARKAAQDAAARQAEEAREALAQRAVLLEANSAFSTSGTGGDFASSFAKQDASSNLVSQENFPQATPLTAVGATAAASAIEYALAQMGTPYVWGGTQPGGFDCSGLVQWSYGQSGVSIERTTYAMWSSLPHVSSPADLQPGDVVFFENLGHEALYLGDGLIVEAPHTGDVVHVRPLAMDAGEMGYDGAVRPGDLAGAAVDLPQLSVVSQNTATN